MNGAFTIGSQTAGQNIYNIAGDMNITQNSPPEDVLKIFLAIQQKVSDLEIDDKNRKEITKQIESAKFELKDKNPDKSSIEESLKKTTGILKEAKATGNTLKEIGVMVGKAAVWLGTNAAALGWIL
jgi:hypothetical protein